MLAQWEQEKNCLVSWKFRDSLLLAKRRYAYTYGLLKLFASGMTVAVIKGGPLQIKALSAALKSPDSQLKWGHSALPRHLRRQVPGPASLFTLDKHSYLIRANHGLHYRILRYVSMQRFLHGTQACHKSQQLCPPPTPKHKAACKAPEDSCQLWRRSRMLHARPCGMLTL